MATTDQTLAPALARIARLTADGDADGVAEALVDLAVDELAADGAAAMGFDDTGAVQPVASRGVPTPGPGTGGEVAMSVAAYVERIFGASFVTKIVIELPFPDRRLSALVFLHRQTPASAHVVTSVTRALVEIMAATTSSSAPRSARKREPDASKRHELRNLLHGVALNLELVKRCMPPDRTDGLEAIARIVAVLSRARALVT